MSEPVRIGSRRSRLALVQSRHVADLLTPSRACEIVEIDTSGDRRLDSAVPEIGGKGLFTQELEAMLLSGEIDVAVHSLKDLPTELADGLALGAVSARQDPRDALVLPPGAQGALDDLPRATRVGTGSLRRRAQILHRRPDLDVVPIRGNVPTRLDKLDRGDVDAVVLAAAGLARLGLSSRATALLATDVLVPAPGQGALGVECRAGDPEILDLLSGLHDPATALACRLERRVLELLEGGCNTPIGVHAELTDGAVHLLAVVSDADGRRVLRETAEGKDADWEKLAESIVARLRAGGAGDIIRSLRDVS